MSEVTLRETLAVEEHPPEALPDSAPPEQRLREFAPGLGFWVATGWIVFLVVLALLVDVLPFQDPLAPDPRNTSAGPSLDHWFGTDTLGRDLLARVAYGTRISLLVAFVSSVVAAVIGSLLGFLAGYVRGRTERVVMSAMDVMLAFPTLIFALALVAFLGASTGNVIIAIAVIAVPVFARLVRAQTLTYSEREFVVASRATGATDRRTLLTEIAPNVVPSILAFALVLAALAIVIEGGPQLPRSRRAPADAGLGQHHLLRSARARERAAHQPHPRGAHHPHRARPEHRRRAAPRPLRRTGQRAMTSCVPRPRRPALPLARWRSLARNGEGAPVTLLRVEGLTTFFRTRRGIVRAVDDVSLDLEAGTTLAIVGESGSGKSVLTRSLLGLHTTTNIERADGRVFFDGVDLRALPRRELRRIWGQRIGLVSQNPMVALNPVVRVGRQITEVLRKNRGFSETAARARAVELLEAVGIPDPQRRMREYPHQLSGGLRQRVTIAIAISCEPDLLIADEPTTALDVTVQAQILALLRSLQQERGMAMIFVSHDLGVVAGLADEIAVMYAGRIVEKAPTRALFRRPRMPYTEALLSSIPTIGQSGTRLRVIEGRPPDMVQPPSGCRFHPRCPYRGDRCTTEMPPLDSRFGDHAYACWYPLSGGRDADTTEAANVGR